MTFRPIAKIVQKSDEDGWHCSDVIEYRCPICNKILKGYLKPDKEGDSMIQFLIGLIIGVAITVFAIALTSIDDEERRK